MTLVAELEPEVTVAGTTHGAGGAHTEFLEPTPLAVPRAWEFDEDDTHVVADARTWGETWYRAVGCAVVGMLGVLAVVVLGADDRNPDAGLVAPPTAIPILPSAPVPTGSTMAETPTLAPEDERFLAMLARDGHPRPVSVPNAVAAAADVCRMISRGDDFGYVESWLVPPRGIATQEQAEIFVSDALAAYCPHAAIPTATHAPAALPSVDPDQGYLADLNSGGVRVTDVGAVIQGAHEICSDLSGGKSKTAIESYMMAGNHTFTEGNAATVLNSAVAAYCPQYRG